MAGAKKPKIKVLDDPKQVREFLDKLEHPLKAEIEAVRAIIVGVDERITEGIKWNAPSFYYKGDMVVIHVRAQQQVHLVWPSGAEMGGDFEVLEGVYPDGRKMSYFRNMAEVKAKQSQLKQAVRAWIRIQDAKSA